MNHTNPDPLIIYRRLGSLGTCRLFNEVGYF